MLRPIPEPSANMAPYLLALARQHARPIGIEEVEIGETTITYQVWIVVEGEHNPPLWLRLRGDLETRDVAIIGETIDAWRRLCQLSPFDEPAVQGDAAVVYQVALVLTHLSYCAEWTLAACIGPNVVLLRWGHLHHTWWLRWLDQEHQGVLAHPPSASPAEMVDVDGTRMPLETARLVERHGASGRAALAWLYDHNKFASTREIVEGSGCPERSCNRAMNKATEEGIVKVRRYKNPKGKATKKFKFIR